MFYEAYYTQNVYGSKNNKDLLIKKTIILKELKKILLKFKSTKCD